MKSRYTAVSEIIAIELNSGSDVRELLTAIRQRKIIVAKLSNKFVRKNKFLARLISHIRKLKAKVLALNNYSYLVIVPDEIKIRFKKNTPLKCQY